MDILNVLFYVLGAGKGQNYENKNIEIQKEHRNVSKHQNIKSVFLVHHYYYNQNIESVFLVHHYNDNQSIEKNIEIDFRCSDFTYGVKKDHNVEN
jgi:hypothetical protein